MQILKRGTLNCMLAGPTAPQLFGEHQFVSEAAQALKRLGLTIAFLHRLVC